MSGPQKINTVPKDGSIFLAINMNCETPTWMAVRYINDEILLEIPDAEYKRLTGATHWCEYPPIPSKEPAVGSVGLLSDIGDSQGE